MRLKHPVIIGKWEFLIVSTPFVFSNVTQPLMGVVNTAIIGHMPNAAYLSGVAVGTTIFNTLYWLFGFLRVSTTGFSAQAVGQNDRNARVNALLRPLAMAIVVGMAFVLLQEPIWSMFSALVIQNNQVRLYAGIYYHILIFGAPFVLVNYVFLGWLMGQQRLWQAAVLQAAGNVIGAILAYVFVLWFNFDVAGVAWATLISQIISFGFGLWLVIHFGKFQKADFRQRNLFRRDDMMTIMRVNLDMMMRTGCLVLVSNLFIRQAGELGTEVLAANTVINQITNLMIYAYEGLGNAASIYAGRAIGEKNQTLMTSILYRTVQLSIWFVLISMGGYFLFQEQIVQMFSNIPEVRQLVGQYQIFVMFYPVAACFGFSLYGIFSGATITKPGRNALIYSTILYIVLSYITVGKYGNSGLWFSYLIYFAGRTAFLLPYLGKLRIVSNTASGSQIVMESNINA